MASRSLLTSRRLRAQHVSRASHHRANIKRSVRHGRGSLELDIDGEADSKHTFQQETNQEGIRDCHEAIQTITTTGTPKVPAIGDERRRC